MSSPIQKPKLKVSGYYRLEKLQKNLAQPSKTQ